MNQPLSDAKKERKLFRPFQFMVCWGIDSSEKPGPQEQKGNPLSRNQRVSILFFPENIREKIRWTTALRMLRKQIPSHVIHLKYNIFKNV
jgi:hypothetical protein